MTITISSQLRAASILWFEDPAAADARRVGGKAAALARLADRRGNRLPAVAGLSLLVLSTAALAAMGSAPTALGLVAALLLGGIGLGLSGAALQTAAMEAVEQRHTGVAAGLYSTGRYAGSIGSAALLALVLGDGSGHAGAFFAVTAVAAAGAALLALRLGPPRAAAAAIVAEPEAAPAT